MAQMTTQKKIKVPEGMLKAARDGISASVEKYGFGASEAVGMCLKAALLWLSENPISPTIDQIGQMEKAQVEGRIPRPPISLIGIITEWQRRMFLELEPEISPTAQTIIRSMRGVTLSPSDADAILIEIFRVAHGWNPDQLVQGLK